MGRTSRLKTASDMAPPTVPVGSAFATVLELPLGARWDLLRRHDWLLAVHHQSALRLQVVVLAGDDDHRAVARLQLQVGLELQLRGAVGGLRLPGLARGAE